MFQEASLFPRFGGSRLNTIPYFTDFAEFGFAARIFFLSLFILVWCVGLSLSVFLSLSIALENELEECDEQLKECKVAHHILQVHFPFLLHLYIQTYKNIGEPFGSPSPLGLKFTRERPFCQEKNEKKDWKNYNMFSGIVLRKRFFGVRTKFSNRTSIG
jgi:hypothetical protein